MAFDFIACAVLEQTFYDPMVRDYALDGCYENEKGCGDQAADAFCQDEGYSEATEYALVEADEETMYIGNNVICNPSHHECNTVRLFFIILYFVPLFTDYLTSLLFFKYLCSSSTSLASHLLVVP